MLLLDVDKCKFRLINCFERNCWAIEQWSPHGELNTLSCLLQENYDNGMFSRLYPLYGVADTRNVDRRSKRFRCICNHIKCRRLDHIDYAAWYRLMILCRAQHHDPWFGVLMPSFSCNPTSHT